MKKKFKLQTSDSDCRQGSPKLFAELELQGLSRATLLKMCAQEKGRERWEDRSALVLAVALAVPSFYYVHQVYY